MAVMKRGVLGGTFDPVHRAHVELVECAQEQLALDTVTWIPAGDPWRKRGRTIASAADRLAMVQLAVADEPTWSVSTVELERKGPTYSVDTMEELREQYEDDSFTLVLGQDALEDLPNWREPERLIQLAALAVAVRSDKRQTNPELEALLPGLSKRVIWLDMPQLPFSATQIRTLASKGTPLMGFVPASVEAYIHEHHLYVAT